MRILPLGGKNLFPVKLGIMALLALSISAFGEWTRVSSIPIKQEHALKAGGNDNVSTLTSSSKVDESTGGATSENTSDPHSNYAANFQSEDPDVKLVIEQLGIAMKSGFEQGDLSLLREILTEDFESWVHLPEDKISVDDRMSYLEARGWWEQLAPGTHKLTYTVLDAVLNANRDQISIFALATYGSKYFSPSFGESLAFIREDNAWRLSFQSFVPLHPEDEDDFEPKIYVVNRPSNGMASWASADLWDNGPDWVVDQFDLEELESGFPAKNDDRHVLVVFSEAPMLGSTITVEHIFQRKSGTVTRFSYDYPVTKAAAYMIVHSRIRVLRLDGKLTVGVSLNDREIASEVFKVWNP